MTTGYPYYIWRERVEMWFNDRLREDQVRFLLPMYDLGLSPFAASQHLLRLSGITN